MQSISLTALILCLMLSTSAWAKEAVPMAADPELEKKVMEISEELRCLVCQNQTIADSDAGLAKDLKDKVRSMLKEGKTKEEINTYMVNRYGDFVLYRPPIKPTTIFLWVGPGLLLIIGLVILFTVLKNRKKVVVDAPLSDEEQNRLQAILESKKDGGEGVKS